MAEININMNRYNGSTYDTLYPATTISQVANGQQQIKVVNIALAQIGRLVTATIHRRSPFLAAQLIQK